MSTKVLTLVGSLRAGSVNRQLADTAALTAGADVDIVIFDGIGQVPFYNEDIDVEGSVPEAAAALRAAAASADALLLVCPEYNGTMPAVLKNAIDWLSRPFGTSAISGTPAAVIGSAFGQYGGVWAHDDARKVLGIAGARVIDDVRLSIGGSVSRFAEIHPKDDSEIVEQLRGVVSTLAGEAEASAA
ncbi:NADPH-dependent FMN reductase [Arthrobacter sp. zg-Y820]|uniref:NAD(P)H-dependent oxidoreductase n=1 Tax=unclassified Arthrobacter TaxID=235627 RepID=UPI001E2FFDDA|nr:MULTISPECIES: NADPH-dependent FMN reductase [unclassified Arthrobacter]MCC9197235.1 NAD(P)H-dependent oxidoreductase [Arthrobacter sp. zg-Y820]MDK1280100.1 NADPH-dependent FMN reductase [Arthrobacter sp. zg.Y820]WIB09393.1 NADPH-dependent FMN reductase [Arthrobacter sp. zg-Y820]